jgi:hypothetical protein
MKMFLIRAVFICFLSLLLVGFNACLTRIDNTVHAAVAAKFGGLR